MLITHTIRSTTWKKIRGRTLFWVKQQAPIFCIQPKLYSSHIPKAPKASPKILSEISSRVVVYLGILGYPAIISSSLPSFALLASIWKPHIPLTYLTCQRFAGLRTSQFALHAPPCSISYNVQIKSIVVASKPFFDPVMHCLKGFTLVSRSSTILPQLSSVYNYSRLLTI